EAIKDYDIIIQANSMDDDALLKRADVYFQKGDYGKALADYNEAIDLYPQSAYAHSARSKVLRKLGKSDQADLDEKRALELKKAPAIKKI
ncbi:MAG TPA: tetratricopeptide repeat protein, partial [Candidatus Melainabacteria bacterium]|nr:tetratricopeptide repeat protein [Candidatus Melainabacteria bacterium]